MGIFEKLRQGLKKTKDSMIGGIEGILNSFTKIDDELFEELEETLILSDIGVNTAVKICDSLREKVKKTGEKNPENIKNIRITSYNVCYTKLLRLSLKPMSSLKKPP